MGRCYEFGAIVREGCGHAMVVTDEGGSCACPECGAGCEGLFKGCAAVVSRPGYVPVSAPSWARPGGSGVPEAPDQVPARRAGLVAPEVAVAAPTLHPTPSPVPAPTTTVQRSEPDRTADAVEVLHRRLEERDIELAAAFGRLSDAYTALTEELAFEREARVRLVNAVHDLSARMDAATRPLFGLKTRR